MCQIPLNFAPSLKMREVVSLIRPCRLTSSSVSRLNSSYVFTPHWRSIQFVTSRVSTKGYTYIDRDSHLSVDAFSSDVHTAQSIQSLHRVYQELFNVHQMRELLSTLTFHRCWSSDLNLFGFCTSPYLKNQMYWCFRGCCSFLGSLLSNASSASERRWSFEDNGRVEVFELEADVGSVVLVPLLMEEIETRLTA